MKLKLLSAITAGLLFCSLEQKAQVSAYTFSQSLSTYGAPNSGSLVGIPIQDDDVTTVTLPFPFTFNGVSHTSIDVCSNGYMSFNSLSGFEYPPISDNGTQDLISALGDDLYMGSYTFADMAAGSNSLTNVLSVAGFSVGDILWDWGGDFASNPVITAINGNVIELNQNALNSNTFWDIFNTNGSIKHEVLGTAPNRICEFEFATFSRYGAPNEFINFKVRLYETSNNIEFLYGDMSPFPGQSFPEVGLKGNTNTDFNSRSVVVPATWANSSAATSASDYCEFDLGSVPVNGQSYMWVPAAAVSCTTPVLSITSTSATICTGSSATLTGSGATTYSWTNGPATDTFVVNPTASTDYTLTGFNGTCTASMTFSQIVTAMPVITISQSTVACKGTPVDLVASGATTYSWANGGPTSATVTVSQMATGIFTVYGSSGACTSSATITHSFIPVPMLTPMYTQSTLCIGQTGTMWLDGVTTGLTFTWSNAASTTASLTVTPSSTIMPALNVVASNGTCQATYGFIQHVSECTGINEASADLSNSILVYPNPFNASLSLKNSKSEEAMVTVSDALGKIVYTTKIKGDSTEAISTESLKSGLYFISVSTNEGSFTKKLIKE